MRILFTGGGSGGHVFPIIATIRELKRIAEEERILDLELFYMGPQDFGQEQLAAEEVIIVPIMSGKMRRYASFQNVTDFFRTIGGVFQAIWNVFLITPDVVFSKGGYGAFPAVVAAAVLHIPLIIHESDAVPGRVNKFAGRFAKRIGIAFPGAAPFFSEKKVALVGIPIRKRILGGNRDIARENLAILSDLPVIGIIGGSQGAARLNDAALGILKELTERYEIIHQTGEKNFQDVMQEASVILEFGHKERYHAFGFLDEPGLRDFYVVSDLIISRGSSSLFEIAAWGKPSILIPIRNSAQDHQRKNAYEYAAAGACIVIEEPNLSPHVLFAEIKKVLDNPELLQKMRAAAQKFSRIDAAELIAREILKMGLHQK
ncbi:MAG: UDP-N-acetylglucosamine--N-acetylmuramyl-(pentapeptide) pyrophosphoryl-undecaprenol N-acetylglucosamine transferase [Candidatus Sungbacteria bacterium]|nr:UDP-N-acetylglucosamine--N-acetylmuramyl-(pentapeptide) pyrophosphoryl-undecaprenol N-acetylglucosamine transferase [Candidatus Sungbacteria bacterium]